MTTFRRKRRQQGNFEREPLRQDERPNIQPIGQANSSNTNEPPPEPLPLQQRLRQRRTPNSDNPSRMLRQPTPTRRNPPATPEAAKLLHWRHPRVETPNLDRLRSRKHRQQQPQPLGQKVTRLPSPAPLASFPQPSPIKQLSLPQTGLTQRQNPWEVQKSKMPDPPVSDTRGGSNSPVVTENHNSPSINLGRGRKQRRLPETASFQPLNPPVPTRQRRRHNSSRISEKLASPRTPTGTTRSSSRRVQPSPSPASSSPKTQSSRRLPKQPKSPLVYIIRLLILGIGIGAIAGTILSALNPALQASAKNQDQAKTQIQESPTPESPSASVQLTQEIPSLKAQIQTLATQNPTLQPGVFVVDLETGAYLDFDGQSTLASASTIKLPILVAFFQDVDAGKVRLDELLTMKSQMIAEGSGDLQYKKAGTKYTALEVATKMIAISDNTATNMLLERLGGAQELNQRFQSWGLTTTVIRNQLPDVEGTNTTSPKELASLLAVVHRGGLVSSQSRDRILDIMQKNEINTLLPQGLGAGATIAHKTGNIGSILADVGLVNVPTGKHYIISVMVKRPHNDAGAQQLIREISKRTYDYFNPPRVTPSNNLTPAKSPRTLTRALASDNSIN